MNKCMFLIVAVLLWGNVAFAQDDAERKKHFKLVERIMANPDKIAEIIDSSEYYNAKVRTNDLRDIDLQRIQAIIKNEFIVDGTMKYTFLKDDDFKITMSSGDGGRMFHGIIYSHEVTVKNRVGNKFLSFKFSRLAGVWYFSYIYQSTEYPRLPVPFCPG